MEGGITFKLLNLTPYIMNLYIYRDFKVENGEIDYLLLQQRRRGQFSTLTFDPIHNDVLYLS